jgi:hypothetical protein
VHDTEELESNQNITPNGYNKSNIAIYHKHQINYCREYRPPKKVIQVPHAGQSIRVPLEIGITQIQLIDFQIWILGEK